MLSKCPRSPMTARDGRVQNCQDVQGASNDIKAITDIIRKVSLKNFF